jgi:hypothetical protein
MSDKTKIQQVIETYVQPKFNALKKTEAEQKPKVQDVINKLSDAIRSANKPSIERLLGMLEEQKAGPYAQVATQARTLLAQVKKLKAADGSEDAKRLLDITNSLGEFEARVNRNFDGIKKIEDIANDVMEKSVAEGSKAREEWQDMEGWLKAELEAAKLHLKAMELLDELAKDSVETGDQAHLTDAIKRSQDRSKWKPTQKEIQDKFAKFCAKCESSGLNKDLVDQLTRDRVKFKAIVDELAGINRKMDEIQLRVQNSYIAKVDHKALARALKITDAKAVERLKLALRPEGEARARALRALQNDFNVKISPKDFERLMKAKVE